MYWCAVVLRVEEFWWSVFLIGNFGAYLIQEVECVKKVFKSNRQKADRRESEFLFIWHFRESEKIEVKNVRCEQIFFIQLRHFKQFFQFEIHFFHSAIITTFVIAIEKLADSKAKPGS